MNKKALKKETSAIFLGIVLVLGTIALTVPSFSVEAQATSDRQMDYDHDEYKKSYDKDDYKSEYSSYGKYDRDHDKSEKDSKIVSIKKVKCNNINVNLNGIDVNIGGLPINGPVTDPVAVAQEDEDDDIESYSIENDNDESYEGKDGKSDASSNSKIVCINNNNNIVVAEEPPEEECAETDDIEACFEEFLNDEQFELLTDALESQAGITVEINGQDVTLKSFNDICEAFEGLTTFDQLLDAIFEILDETLPDNTPIISIELVICIADALDIPVPPV